MRNRYKSAAASLAVVSSLGLFASACTESPSDDPRGWDWPGPVGSLGLALELAPGVVLSTIEYEISGQGFTRTGTLEVPGTGSTFTATITEVPAGTGHVIRLRSRAEGDAGVACAGMATFDVVEAATTDVGVVLSCDLLQPGGSVNVNGSFNICPSVTSTSVSPTVQSIGGTIAVTLSARDVDHAPSPISYTWTTNTGTLDGATTNTPTLTCTQPGPVMLSYVVRDGACMKTGSLSAVCGSAIDAGVGDGGTGDGGFDAGPGDPANIVINEVESNGGTPDDWIELYNKGSQAVNMSGWLVRDSEDDHTYTIPANTVLAPGAYLVIESAQLGYGLGGADAVRLFSATGTPLDSYTWSGHATLTYGRCPNGLGAFGQTASTKGVANACGASDAGVDGGTDAGADGGPDAGPLPWPGSATVTEVDALNAFPSNLSGLTYQAGATEAEDVLWAVLNDPSKIYRLQFDGTAWRSSTTNGWENGKLITYPSGTGRPDSESLTTGVGTSLYVATERDNAMNGVSRLAILQFDSSAAGAALPAGVTLSALREWVLTADLPSVGANLGLEAITFISDAELTEQGFREQGDLPYNQARYAQNGGGVFVVGVEGTGMLHVYALDHSGTGAFTRLASVASGMTGVMGIEYDAATNYLWVYGDDTQGNRSVLFEIEQNVASLAHGQFVQRKVFERPAGLPASNHEGIAYAPDARCVSGARAFFWSDDSNANGHALRRGTIPCGKTY